MPIINAGLCLQLCTYQHKLLCSEVTNILLLNVATLSCIHNLHSAILKHFFDYLSLLGQQTFCFKVKRILHFLVKKKKKKKKKKIINVVIWLYIKCIHSSPSSHEGCDKRSVILAEYSQFDFSYLTRRLVALLERKNPIQIIFSPFLGRGREPFPKSISV